MVLVLEAIKQPNDPIRTRWGRSERRAFQHIPLSTHMSLLALTQHIHFSHLHPNHKALHQHQLSQGGTEIYLLHRVQLSSLPFLNKTNDSKRSMPDCLELHKGTLVYASALLT